MTDEEMFYADVAERAYVAAMRQGSKAGGSCTPYFLAAAIAVREAVYVDSVADLQRHLEQAHSDDYPTVPTRGQAQYLYNLGARAPKKETK